MFIRDLRLKRGRVQDIVLANVHLPVRLGHRDAAKLFAEPLKAQLAATGLGIVLDCTLRKRDSGEVIGVDLSIGLRDISTSAIARITPMLEQLAAPCGSSLRLVDAPGTPILFGRAEGLELSVDRDAAPTAEARRDLAHLCRAAIETIGVNRGWVEKDGRTRFFFYGEDLTAMRERLMHILSEHPRYSGASLRRLA